MRNVLVYRRITIVLLAGVVAVFAAAPTAFGTLIGWWKLDETAGLNAADSSAGGHNGTVWGGITTASGVGVDGHSSPGSYGWVTDGGHAAIQLNNNGPYCTAESPFTYVELTDGTGPALGTATFTLAAWIKHMGTGKLGGTGGGGAMAEPIIGKACGEGDGNNTKDANYFLGLNANKKLNVDFETYVGGGNKPLTGITSIIDNEWTHVAATYDGSWWRLYVNGVLDASLNTSGATPCYTSWQRVGIGANLKTFGWSKGTTATDMSGAFNGMISDARIYDNALTQPEILALTIPEPSTLVLLLAGAAALLVFCRRGRKPAA
jgi:hypothetical protein